MSAYFIIQVDVLDAAAFEPYRQDGPAIIASHGGEYVVRGGDYQVLEGEPPLPRQVVIRFPDRAAALRWYESPEYRDLRALRQRSAKTNMILVDGAA